MDTETKKFVVAFPKSKKATFFEITRKHTLRKIKGKHTHVSRDIDKILYGT